MENIKVGKNVNKEYYLQNEKDFSKLDSLISLMPNFAVIDKKNCHHEDLYYETPDLILKSLEGSSIRIRHTEESSLLTIICSQNGERREFEMEIAPEDVNTVFENETYISFLEDKIRDIYAHRLDVDFIRKIKTLKVFMAVLTNRVEYTLINNSGTKIIVCFDKVDFVNKKRTIHENILEIKLDCYAGKDNLFVYERFLKELNRKVVLIPMMETKYEAGLRAFKFVDMSKKEIKEFKEQMKKEKAKANEPAKKTTEAPTQVKKNTFG